MQDLEADTELKHSTSSSSHSAVVPFEARERMEGEHIPETNLTRHHEVFKGDRSESSALRLARCWRQVCLSELSHLPVVRRLSENSQRDVDSHKHMIR